MLVDPAIAFHASAQRYCNNIVDEVAEEIRTGGLVPVDTGALRDSYYSEDNEHGGSDLKSRVDYSLPVEFGTDRGSPEQAHIRPAFEIVLAKHRGL